MQVSQLDALALAGIVHKKAWEQDLLKQVIQYARQEESTVVSLFKLRDEEDL
jgi:hypothetical protein